MHWRLGQFCCLREIARFKVESRVPVIVFALLGVKKCKSCSDLSPRKVIGKLQDVAILVCESESGRNVQVSMAVSETSDMSHDVFFPVCNEGTGVCTTMDVD